MDRILVRSNFDERTIISNRDVIKLLTTANSDFQDIINRKSNPFNLYCFSSVYEEVGIRRIIEYFLEYKPLEKQVSGVRELIYSNSHSAVRILTQLGIKVFVNDLSPTAAETFKSAIENGLLIYDTKLETEEDSLEEAVYAEGKRIDYKVVRFERSPKARKAAIQIHGLICKACDFDFLNCYGELGKDFIEVHHKHPLAFNSESATNPYTDLTVLCSNCHKMIHRGNNCLPVEELREIIEKHIMKR